MALLWIDGFDHYTTSTTNATDFLTGAYNALGPGIQAMPELGGLGLQFPNLITGLSNHDGRVERILGEKTSGMLGVGFHYYGGSGHLSTTAHRLLTLRDTVSNVTRFALGVTAGGALTIRQGLASSVLGTASTDMATNTLYHIELQYHWGVGDGKIEVRLNGETVIDVDDLTIDDPINALRLGVRNGTATYDVIHFDNLYIYDETSGGVNDWIGERRIYTLRPDEDLSPQEWDLSTGSDAYDLLNNLPSDPDNDYIESLEPEDESRFGLDNLPTTDIAVVGVMVAVQGQKTGTDPGSIAFGVNGGEQSKSLTTDQALWFSSIYEENPVTEEGWTAAAVDGATLNIRRSV